jgi:tRNA nucleotidyltransferase/poly(A) polymerase
MKIYLVGGAVRDKLLGLKPKDLDYVMVLDTIEGVTAEDGFQIMTSWMINEGYNIRQSYRNYYTIRAKFPDNHTNKGKDADFVLARKEMGYIEGTREPILVLGTLFDDLVRRDFTINAMALGEDGTIVDYFEGQLHLKEKMLVTPTDPNITLLNDPLRLLRALRFSITRDLFIHIPILEAVKANKSILDKLSLVVSQERIEDELNKMLKHDTILTLNTLNEIDKKCCKGKLFPSLFKNEYYLKMTNKSK